MHVCNSPLLIVGGGGAEEGIHKLMTSSLSQLQQSNQRDTERGSSGSSRKCTVADWDRRSQPAKELCPTYTSEMVATHQGFLVCHLYGVHH